MVRTHFSSESPTVCGGWAGTLSPALFLARHSGALVMRGYPFGIFYSVEGERLFVQVVLDLRQSPENIRRRLSLES